MQKKTEFPQGHTRPSSKKEARPPLGPSLKTSTKKLSLLGMSKIDDSPHSTITSFYQKPSQQKFI